MDFPIRINKYLAHKGIATRRGADALIAKGVVFVNGQKATVGQSILATDRVEVKSKKSSTYTYYAYHKPRGIITHSPEEGDIDIVSAIQRDHKLTGVFPVGRLDKDSEGLIVLTNDGRITERLLGKEHAYEKEYDVTLDKKISGHFLKHMRAGVSIEGYATKPATVTTRGDTLCRITILEGKKHQIRRMCAALGYQVKKLKRVRVGTILLGQLASGALKEIAGKQKEEFLTSLGLPF